MRVCFFGLGSIGSRHLKNLITIFHELGLDYNITALKTSKGDIYDVNKFLDKIIYNDEELEEHYDLIFITNPTSCHYETLTRYIDKSTCFFIEKPVFESYKDIKNISLNKVGTYYVACPLRYSKIMQNLKNRVDSKDIQPISVRVVCSSYLPDWRPLSDYSKSYSANKAMGGGVSIDLIHELDYITYLFGFPMKIDRFIARYSSLNIETDDLAVYILTYEDKLVELHLDYFGRKSKRNIEIYTDDNYYLVDLLDNSITSMNGKVSFCESNNDKYIEELSYYVDCVLNEKKSHNEIEHAQKVMQLAREDY